MSLAVSRSPRKVAPSDGPCDQLRRVAIPLTFSASRRGHHAITATRCEPSWPKVAVA